jgi:small subunit ribosomal protein S20
MAHHKSAQKRIRRNQRRYEINHARKSRIRTYVKKVEMALANRDPSEARAALRQAEPELQRAVRKGVLHQNAAARKISRLTQRVKALG